MKSIEIKGDLRKSTGKKDSKNLRTAGKVPCVIYGGKENIHFSVDEKALKKLVYTPYVYITVLEIDGKKVNSIIQDVQFDPVSDRTIHVDFLQVFDDKPVVVDIPVKITGLAPGVKSGGKMQIITRKLTVKALSKDLPDTLDVNVDKLQLGKSIKVGNLVFDNLELLSSKNAVVVSVKLTRAAKGMAGAALTEEEAAEEEEKAE
ncbi:MAG: 50S ribosomal protein L25/general stress protein Ctc [Bacteroidales bacterium]|nr:50S ribosomal protein L25/general stress protein Ctc [Bacteroidales bacterium]MBN2758341.1 50S ribosomal protein L25/general stress protein Ctc [Bacteroidales bacterium]